MSDCLAPAVVGVGLGKMPMSMWCTARVSRFGLGEGGRFPSDSSD